MSRIVSNEYAEQVGAFVPVLWGVGKQDGVCGWIGWGAEKITQVCGEWLHQILDIPHGPLILRDGNDKHLFEDV
eukprot:1148879-Pelagomonas_calceolata.AAC.3